MYFPLKAQIKGCEIRVLGQVVLSNSFSGVFWHTCCRYQIELMFRQSQGSQFTLVWEFKQITILLKKIVRAFCIFVATKSQCLSLVLMQMRAAVHLPPMIQ